MREARIRMKFFFFSMMLLSATIVLGQDNKWGWDAHRYINEKAVNYLPSEMAFWQAQQSFLRQHSVDPDQDNNPGYYHYIDIDVYPAFFNGTLPHEWAAMVSQYGYNNVVNNGTVPWVIEQWSDSLSSLMQQGKWTQAWQVAAELGHYVADAHQPLHLTENYNGQLTGNYGIHSRYETQMISPYLSSLSLPNGNAQYWQNPLDSVFAWIDLIYPYVADIMAADSTTAIQDPSYSTVYYNRLWQLLEVQTTDAIHRAILDLASIWYTSWVNAGSPNPTTGVRNERSIPQTISLEAWPNPFNPQITLSVECAGSQPVQVKIFDLSGRLIANLFSGSVSNRINLIWNGKSDSGMRVASGTYLVVLQQGEKRTQQKIIFSK